MKFQVIRTGTYYSSEKALPPCVGAKSCTIQRVTLRVTLGRGGVPLPAKDVKVWTIEVPSLEALMDFIKQEGRVIISEDSPYPRIEIYDDIRE